MTAPTPGDTVRIGAAASVQFAGDRALRLRIVSVDPRPTYHGWIWLTGYVLNKRGEATDKREVYVQRAGIEIIAAQPAPATRRVPPARRSRSLGTSGPLPQAVRSR